MSKIVAKVDAELLARLMAWAADLPDFALHHAADGLYIAQACRSAGLPEDREAVFLVALVITYWFWFDDRSDKFLRDHDTPVDWQRLLRIADDPDHTDAQGDTPEERWFQRMSKALQARARSPEAHRWWVRSSVRVIAAMHSEEVVSRSGEVPTFVECLENGGDSTTLMSIMSSAYLAYGLDRPARDGDVRLTLVERYMLLSQRLQNDLYSAEKERRELAGGRPSNLVLMLEKLVSREQARAFCEAQRSGYERMMQHNIDLLGPDDWFCRMTHTTMQCIRGWYETGPLRYSEEA